MAGAVMGDLVPADASRLAEAGPAQRWLEASELFLGSLNSERTRIAYRHALQDLLAFTEKLPWQIERSDLQRWVADMKERSLAPNTIRLRVSAASSFFRYCIDEFDLLSHNPAGARSLRPAVSPFGKAAYLSPDQAKALLEAIPQDSVQGLQDYALFLTYLITSRRNTEIRALKWGDLTVRGEQVIYRWSGKRKAREDELPQPAYNAILHFLFAAGRMPLGDQDYIFAPLTDRACNLPNVPEESWTRNRALSVREVNRRLKYYARKAGLRSERLRVHSLRHTAAMLRKAAGDDLEQISSLLNHSSLAITQIYLHSIESHRDQSWASVAELLGIE